MSWNRKSSKLHLLWFLEEAKKERYVRNKKKKIRKVTKGFVCQTCIRRREKEEVKEGDEMAMLFNYSAFHKTMNFTKRDELNRHMKEHRWKNNGTKSKTCDRCGKKFTKSHDLTRHLKTHDADRARTKFNCSCGKAYYYHRSLLRHQRSCPNK